MENKETTKLVGKVMLQLIGPDGKVKETRVSNTVQTAGKNAAADQLLAAPTLVKPGWCAGGKITFKTPSGSRRRSAGREKKTF